MDQKARVRSLLQEIDTTETRLDRSVAKGSSEDESVEITLVGFSGVKDVTVDSSSLNLDDDLKNMIEARVKEAVEAALAKKARKVRREISRINQ